jgi:hypothetical protein
LLGLPESFVVAANNTILHGRPPPANEEPQEFITKPPEPVQEDENLMPDIPTLVSN